MFRNQRGFMFVELLIIIVIIGLLAAIAIPNLIVMQIGAKDNATKTAMLTAMQVYNDDATKHNGFYNTYPAVIAELMMMDNDKYLRNAFTGNALKIWRFDKQPTKKLPPGDLVVYKPEGAADGDGICIRGVMHDSMLSALVLTAGTEVRRVN